MEGFALRQTWIWRERRGDFEVEEAVKIGEVFRVFDAVFRVIGRLEASGIFYAIWRIRSTIELRLSTISRLLREATKSGYLTLSTMLSGDSMISGDKSGLYYVCRRRWRGI